MHDLVMVVFILFIFISHIEHGFKKNNTNKEIKIRPIVLRRILYLSIVEMISIQTVSCESKLHVTLKA